MTGCAVSADQRALGAVCALVFALGCGADKPEKPAEKAVWSEAFDTSKTGALSGVWGTGPDDVFIVGGTPAKAEVHHFDGDKWQPMDLPDGVSLLVWSYGFGPDDVYAVGVGGAAVHWDGKAWSKLDSGTNEDLWGVWGANNKDMWVVGGTVGKGAPLILHGDGTKFVKVALEPAENTRDATSLFKVWGIDGEVFAVGEAGLIVRWDGKKWRAQSAGALANDDFVSLWGTSKDHIVAVGGRAGGRIATYDGAKWTTTAPSATPGINAVFMQEPGRAVVGGISGLGGTFDVATGALTLEDTFASRDLHALWCDGAKRCYAVGGLFTAPFAGMALVRTVTP